MLILLLLLVLRLLHRLDEFLEGELDLFLRALDELASLAVVHQFGDAFEGILKFGDDAEDDDAGAIVVEQRLSLFGGLAKGLLVAREVAQLHAVGAREFVVGCLLAAVIEVGGVLGDFLLLL